METDWKEIAGIKCLILRLECLGALALQLLCK